MVLQSKIETQDRKEKRKNSQNGSNMKWQEPRHVGGGLAVARVHQQRSRNYHERRWPVGHSALGPFLGIDTLLGAAAHAMADHSSPNRRARRGADTQRAVYARVPLQVRRGGRTMSMSCNTNVSKLLVRWASNTYSGASYPSSCGACHCMWCYLCPLPPCTLFASPHAACLVSSSRGCRLFENCAKLSKKKKNLFWSGM